jgi:hypothetical protein
LQEDQWDGHGDSPKAGRERLVGCEKAKERDGCDCKHGKQESHNKMEPEQFLDVTSETIRVRPKFDSLIFYVLEPQADRLGADFFTTRFLWG